MEMCVQDSAPGMRAEVISVGNGEFMRRAVCTRDVAAGGVVFDCEPFSCMLASRARAHLCSHCFTAPSSSSGSSSSKLLVCTRCSQARYCGKECQLADWQGGHKHECKQSKALRDEGCSEGPLDDILLMQRTYALTHGAKDDSPCSATAAGAIRCSAAHVQDLCVSGEAASFTEELSVHTLAEAVRRVSVALKQPQQQLLAPLSRLYASFRCNNFAILNPLFQAVGAGVYPYAAILNHSCCPSVLLTYVLRPGRPPLLRGVALSSLSKGQELTHCYVDASLPSSLRKALLQKDYGFACQCACCLPASAASAGASASVTEEALLQRAADPLAVRDLLGALSPAQLAALQPTVDALQGAPGGDSGTATLCAEAAALLATATKARERLGESGTAARDGAPQALLACLQVIEELFSELVAACGPFHMTLYAHSTALFGDLLAETLLLQPLCSPDSDLYASFLACKRLAISVCAHICAYLTLTLRCFPFHPLLGLQLLTWGQLAQQPVPLAWAVQVLSRCNGEGEGGCLSEVLQEARMELANLS